MDVLAGYFSVAFLPPLLLVWLVAAILHVALGSISVAAITAAGILAPLAAGMGVDPVLIALAAGSGALFVPHVSSNFFWMFQTLLGLSTRGTFKTHSVAMTLSSVISLPLILTWTWSSRRGGNRCAAANAEHFRAAGGEIPPTNETAIN